MSLNFTNLRTMRDVNRELAIASLCEVFSNPLTYHLKNYGEEADIQTATIVARSAPYITQGSLHAEEIVRGRIPKIDAKAIQEKTYDFTSRLHLDLSRELPNERFIRDIIKYSIRTFESLIHLTPNAGAGKNSLSGGNLIIATEICSYYERLITAGLTRSPGRVGFEPDKYAEIIKDIFPKSDDFRKLFLGAIEVKSNYHAERMLPYYNNRLKNKATQDDAAAHIFKCEIKRFFKLGVMKSVMELSIEKQSAYIYFEEAAFQAIKHI